VHNPTAQIFSAAYTADGERISLIDGNQARTSSFRLFDEATGGSVTHTPGLAQRKNGADRLYSRDQLGSTRYLSGTDPLDPDYKFGARFDAYGQRTAGGGTDGPEATPRQYAGAWGYERTTDTLGLDYLYQRNYDPAMGRFITRDPIRWTGGLNLYGYVNNDPVGGVDPSGSAMVSVNYEDGEIPLTRGHMLAQEAGAFAADPMLQPGSKERCRYSRFMNTVPFVGQAKGIAEAITGRDSVAGTQVDGLQRASAIFPVVGRFGKGGSGASFWGSFQKWIIRIARNGPPKHSNYYDGATHVYSIHVFGMLWKVGTGNGPASDWVSPRAAKQVVMLNRVLKRWGVDFSYKVRRAYPDAKSAHDYETRLIKRYTSRYGRPPGNPVDR